MTKFSAAALVLLSYTLPLANGDDTFGPAKAVSSRYWDCCKPSCSWTNKASFQNNQPVVSCDKDLKPLFDATQGTGCNGGTSFSCPSNAPWAVNDTFSYGFVGAYLKGGDESTWCCGCYEFNFTDGALKGKRMIVQSTNTDYDSVTDNTFTFSIPGGNTSYAGACSTQYGVPNATFGAENQGVSKKDDCKKLPKALQPGCEWRFDWFKDASYPSLTYKRISCPKELSDITHCLREDETTFQAQANGSATTPNAATGLSVPFIPAIASSFVILVGSWLMLA